MLPSSRYTDLALPVDCKDNAKPPRTSNANGLHYSLVLVAWLCARLNERAPKGRFSIVIYAKAPLIILFMSFLDLCFIRVSSSVSGSMKNPPKQYNLFHLLRDFI